MGKNCELLDSLMFLVDTLPKLFFWAALPFCCKLKTWLFRKTEYSKFHVNFASGKDRKFGVLFWLTLDEWPMQFNEGQGHVYLG